MTDALRRIAGLDDQTLASAGEAARTSGKPLPDILISMGRLTRADLCEAMHVTGRVMAASRLLEIPHYDKIAYQSTDGSILAVTDSRDARKRMFVISTQEVTDVGLMGAKAKAASGGLMFGGRVIVDASFLRVVQGGIAQGAGSQSVAAGVRDEATLHADFDKLGRSALVERASDIHITLRGGRGEVKFRIDGELEHFADWDEEYTIAFCSAAYNTLTENGSTNGGFSATRKQDGAIERVFPEGLVRFRYASAPISPNGFDVTMRLIPLGVEKRHRSLDTLGYSQDQQQDLDRMFAHSSGLIFFLGTTGSGKSTSMAVALEAVARNKPGKKIRTVEQPVEYKIDGAYQTSVDRNEFIPMISQMMRMDPDYMMVGETRDSETASAVLQGARSGHLCVSTLHADGAPLAYDRLQGLGVARQDLASVGLVVGIVYQKLVQMVCPHCRQPAEEFATQNPSAAIVARVRKVNGGTLNGVYFARRGGCRECKGRGVHGRTVCAEILRPTVKMLAAIAAGDSRALWVSWRSTIDESRPDVMRGRTSFEHAIHKMRAGIVSPESVESEFKFLDEPAFEGGMD